MSYYNGLNRLSVEILYELFDYFTINELFYTFLDVNDYINQVLQTYSTYRVNFQSIQRSDFDFLCDRIRPNQVISLILSDDTDTPSQSELFLSHFRIEQFTQLRSLTLIQIEIDSLKLILSNLDQLDQLRALSIHTPLTSSIESHRLNSNLRCLTLDRCTGNELENILLQLPYLQSLNVCLNITKSKFDLNFLFKNLIRLNLKIENYSVSINEMEQFLIQFRYLKHFILETDGQRDLFDGYRWPLLISSLLTFNFQFHAHHHLIENILQSFRTTFWIKQKQWFVAYQDYSLFSIPYFAPTHLDISQQLRIHSTAPNDFYLYNSINKIIMKTSAIKHNQYFTNIKTLELKYPVSLKTIALGLDLYQIQHLILVSYDDLIKYIPLELSMPQLRQLTIEKNLTFDMIEQIQDYEFKKIQKLDIGIDTREIDYIIKKLSRLFPYVHCLILKSGIQSKSQIIRILEKFQHLRNASFFAGDDFYQKEIKFRRNPYSIVRYSNRLTKNKFTCKMNRPSTSDLIDNNHLWIHFWIEDKSHSLNGLSHQRYYWYRFKHISLRILRNRNCLKFTVYDINTSR